MAEKERRRRKLLSSVRNGEKELIEQERKCRIWLAKKEREAKLLLARQRRNRRLLASFNGKVKTDQYQRKEKRWTTTVTIVNYGIDFKFELNKFICPVDEDDGFWILKCNLLVQPRNNYDLWMNRKYDVGYQYLCKHRNPEIARKLKCKLRDLMMVLIPGFMRFDYREPILCLVQIVCKNIDLSIAVFREFNIEYDPEPRLVAPPIDLVTSGFMRRFELHIIGIHKIVENYIDAETGMYLEWSTESELVGEYNCTFDI